MNPRPTSQPREVHMPDRFGDDDPPEPHECDQGWQDADADVLAPCLVCRPWLAPERRIRNLGQ